MLVCGMIASKSSGLKIIDILKCYNKKNLVEVIFI